MLPSWVKMARKLSSVLQAESTPKWKFKQALTYNKKNYLYNNRVILYQESYRPKRDLADPT